MEESRNLIRCSCALYACRICRTKTGWMHQRWCMLSGLTAPGCEDCRYYNPGALACVHPARKVVLRR